MVSEAELQQVEEYAQTFRRNMVRLLNARLKLATKRSNALKSLIVEVYPNPVIKFETYSHKGELSQPIKDIKFCNRNEKRIYALIDGNLDEQEKLLEQAYDYISKNSKDRTLKSNTKKAMKMISIFNKFYKRIGERIQAEDTFLAGQNAANFKKYMIQWRKEVRLNNMLLSRMAGYDTLSEYFRSITTAIKDRPATKLVAGGGVAAVSLTGLNLTTGVVVGSAIVVASFIGMIIVDHQVDSDITKKIVAMDQEVLDLAKKEMNIR